MYMCLTIVNVCMLTMFGFYRATLCVSAVFAVIRCVSVMLVNCIQIAEDIIKLLSLPIFPIILVFFDPEHRYPIPREIPEAGVQNTRVWVNFAIFE